MESNRYYRIVSPAFVSKSPHYPGAHCGGQAVESTVIIGLVHLRLRVQEDPHTSRCPYSRRPRTVESTVIMALFTSAFASKRTRTTSKCPLWEACAVESTVIIGLVHLRLRVQEGPHYLQVPIHGRPSTWWSHTAISALFTSGLASKRARTTSKCPLRRPGQWSHTVIMALFTSASRPRARTTPGPIPSQWSHN